LRALAEDIGATATSTASAESAGSGPGAAGAAANGAAAAERASSQLSQLGQLGSAAARELGRASSQVGRTASEAGRGASRVRARSRGGRLAFQPGDGAAAALDEPADDELDPVAIAAAAIARLRDRARTDLAELRVHYRRHDIVVLVIAFVII